MPILKTKLTDSAVAKLPLPEKGQAFYWCPMTPGFGVRVGATGDRAYIFERRLDGKTVRRTLGKASGPASISADTGRKLKITISGELQTGVDRLEVKRERRQVEKQDSLTLAAALDEYVTGKRRGKDGLSLKPRTIADYLAMVTAGSGFTKAGKKYAGGPLQALADKALHKITADDLRTAYTAAEPYSNRQAVYCLQVLRAVLNWHGVAVPDSPLAKATAGRNRIILTPTAGSPKPIPPELLGAWWRAASQMAGNVSADGCRLILLTGCRPGEIFGSAFSSGLTVSDVNLVGGRLTLQDTKNRKDHTVMLSTQALEIVAAHCAGKRRGAKVFDVLNVGKTLAKINAAAGVVGITPHKLRHTFASVAEELVSGYALKAMLNHTDAADVTGVHYVGKSETQLRAAWQATADFITAA